MLKNSKSISVDLRRRRSYMALKEFNIQSFILIVMVVLLLMLCVLCVAAYPNSNMFAGI